MSAIESIEGIGGGYGQALRGAGIKTVENLLEICCDRKTREQISAKIGISEKLLLKWVNMADLFRVRGVASQYAELLECAGVDTVRELAQRRPDSLHAKMVTTNQAKRVVRQVPSLRIVESWISHAKSLPRKVTH